MRFRGQQSRCGNLRDRGARYGRGKGGWGKRVVVNTDVLGGSSKGKLFSRDNVRMFVKLVARVFTMLGRSLIGCCFSHVCLVRGV